MYVILSSRSGQYHSRIVDGVAPLEAYDYLFYGKKRASFVIARIEHPVKVPIVDEGPPQCINFVPSKFLPQFASLEAARSALRELVSFGSLDVQLVHNDALALYSEKEIRP